MNGLEDIGRLVASARKDRRLCLIKLARQAGVSRTTVYLLESGRATDIGYSKLARILSPLGLELRLVPVASSRPTLEDLLKERDDRDPDLDR